MQIDRREYDPQIHAMYKALSVRQPYADYLTKAVYMDDKGVYHAAKTIEVRTRSTNYRGDLLICAAAKPEIPGRFSGVTCGFVELYDIKPVSEFSDEDWAQTCLPEEERELYARGFGWMVRNPRRVVEMPIRGQLGVYNLIVPKEDITEYPREMALGEDGWERIRNG